MKLFTSRVVLCTFMSIFACGQIALADIPETDFKTVTSKAYVDSLVGGVDISSHKVNGAPLSTTSIVFYGTSDATATAETRNVTMTNNTITTLETGMMVIVKPATTAAYETDALASAAKMQINGIAATAKPMKYQGTSLNKTKAGQVWRAGVPSIWVYDGTAWQFSGDGQYDNNTTYNPMATDAGIAGTDTSTRYVLRPKQLKEIIQGTTLTGFTPGSGDVVATDSITTAIEKLQGAKQPIIAKSATAGVTELIAKPASTGTDGAIRTLTLDTSTLHTANDMYLPSSKLVNTKLGLKLDTANVLNTTASGTSFGGAAIRIPEPLTAWGDVNHKDKLDDGSQLFWVKYAADNGEANNSALTLLTGYSSAKNVPTMDEVASALYGYWETRETTKDWTDVATYYQVRADTLYKLAGMIKDNDPNAVLMEKSGYLDTYAPTLSALMDESAALKDYADSLVRELAASINNRQIIIPEAGKYRASNTASSATTINNSTSSTPNYTTAAVKGTALVTKSDTAGAVGERKVLDSDTDLRDTTVWPAAKVAVSIPSMGKVNDVAQAKKTCYQYSPTNPSKCWLWVLPNDISDIASNTSGGSRT